MHLAAEQRKRYLAMPPLTRLAPKMLLVILVWKTVAVERPSTAQKRFEEAEVRGEGQERELIVAPARRIGRTLPWQRNSTTHCRFDGIASRRNEGRTVTTAQGARLITCVYRRMTLKGRLGRLLFRHRSYGSP